MIEMLYEWDEHDLPVNRATADRELNILYDASDRVWGAFERASDEVAQRHLILLDLLLEEIEQAAEMSDDERRRRVADEFLHRLWQRMDAFYTSDDWTPWE